ncbi:MAG: SDR family NAD(P)-dependent oxidoreductase [Planctomycetota bacterium]|jgi:NAD(P)-dependent dehydrogenase (short-subunit alcohol dehydrogenase family)
MWDKHAFNDRAVLVTGAASGIGEATARRFAEHGADVVLIDLNIDSAKQIAGELKALNNRSFAIQADVTRADEVRAAVKACITHLGKVDILANVAGGFPQRRLVIEMSEEEWDEILDLNLKSVFLFSKAVLPNLIKRRSGRIINISSVAGRSPLHLTAAHYAASKAGILGFTRHLAKEVASYNITVNAIVPGLTLSPRIRRLYNEAYRQEVTKTIPLGRFAEPEDIADAILFLASDAARYITGVTLDVTGGRLMV